MYGLVNKVLRDSAWRWVVEIRINLSASYSRCAARRTGRTLFVAFSFLCLLFGAAALAKDVTVVSIKEAIRTKNGDFTPDPLEESITIEGVLTSAPHKVRESLTLANIQDATAGLVLRASGKELAGLERWDFIRVRGKLGNRRGMARLLVESAERLRAGVVLKPRPVLAHDLNSEQYQGQLVVVEGRLLKLPESKFRFVLQDRSGEIRVNLPSTFLRDLSFAERLGRGGTVELVGIATQYKEKPPYDSGYEISPRDPADFHFAPLPPYNAIAVGSSFALCLAIVLHSWLRKLRIEKQSREVLKLLGDPSVAEQTIREREARLKDLFDHAPVGYHELDTEGRVVRVNQTELRMLGYTAEEIVGRPVWEFVLEGETARRAVESKLAGSEPEPHFERTYMRKDGTHIAVLITERLLRDSLGRVTGIRTAIQDITKTKNLEQQLRQAQKLEAIGSLAGGIAHDFNNLLCVMQGYSELLLGENYLSDQGCEYAEEIRKAVASAASMTRKLLAFSRHQVLNPTVVDLNHVLEGMIGLLRRLIGENIETVLALGPSVRPLFVDSGQIEQVILNLASNARDAMPMGGSLTITTANEDLSEEGLMPGLNELQPGSFVVLSVSDTGIGMDAATKSRIFEPFFTTKTGERGTGMGLATVYGIVRQSGGAIAVDTAPGSGTTFKIYFPAHMSDDLQLQERDKDQTPRDSIRATVLVAEDNAPFRQAVRRMLESRGHKVIEAGDGEEALSTVHNYAGPIDVLLTDILMPRIGGIELAKQAMLLRHGIRVLYMSGYTSDASELLETRTPFLQKPFTQGDLADSLGQILKSETPGTVH